MIWWKLGARCPHQYSGEVNDVSIVAERCAVKQEWASNRLKPCGGVTCTTAQSNTAYERQTNVLIASSDAVFILVMSFDHAVIEWAAPD